MTAASGAKPQPQPSPLDRLRRALVKVMVDEYLTEQAALQRGSAGERPNPVPLPDMEKAA